MPVIALNKIGFREIFPGLRARIVHSARTSQSWVDIDAGATFPEHQHAHEQTVTLLEGRLEITVDGTKHLLLPGHVLILEPHARHSGRALEHSRVLDVFSPPRDDYR